LLEDIVEKVEEINGKPTNPIRAPLIYGQFTNWQPKTMFSLEEYCQTIDSEAYDVIEQMQYDEKCRKEVKTVNDMNDEELAEYQII
jgi:hypothetical protein